jgi:hypothetical protein
LSWRSPTQLLPARHGYHPDSTKHARQGYYLRKRASGKNHNEAMRCLKRRLADTDRFGGLALECGAERRQVQVTVDPAELPAGLDHPGRECGSDASAGLVVGLITLRSVRRVP